MIASSRMEDLRRKLKDSRSGDIALLSHCLLNTNARYLGGASRSGGVAEVVSELLDGGVGIWGVDGSPSCGIAASMDLGRAYDCLARIRLEAYGLLAEIVQE